MQTQLVAEPHQHTSMANFINTQECFMDSAQNQATCEGLEGWLSPLKFKITVFPYSSKTRYVKVLSL